MKDNQNCSVEAMFYGMHFRRLVEKEIEPIREKYGLCRIDAQILMYLGDHQNEKDTSKDILKLNMFTKGHISQSLTRLQKAGYVYMEQDSKDRRYTHNYLTDKAKKLVTSIKKRHAELWEEIMNGITDEEKEVLKNVAIKINKNISCALGTGQ